LLSYTLLSNRLAVFDTEFMSIKRVEKKEPAKEPEPAKEEALQEPVSARQSAL
jgi:hypothetical protein